ncbi:hypothetical protein KMW28_00745 [Flammeovirga yaeyamensis]|uniref:Uncharacterized protein n=1 Tax=Flammeovirga yaeyamensis TaxID=367791 RepID=A0AAX1N3U9_9BACT|nr:hypothetical protein [Flammeovirga yaeyamensis]MBB3699609.1 hypothetical protein [Flammeovirga yaeyamensis]NMF36818.1 hypothetical protein [Flammeovirga yaeyamensis]QWG02142.1 hypothetical protein KMW28_00745 [Flammeovirga yaeyamensis]
MQTAIYTLSLFLFFFVGIFNDDATTSQSTRPTFTVIKQEIPKSCPLGGLHLIEGIVRSADPNEYVDIYIYLQNYDGSWTKQVYKRKGGGVVKLDAMSCNFTGNFYAVADYAKNAGKRMPSITQVSEKHNAKGKNPKFRVTEKYPYKQCEGEQVGTYFKQGEVFTPAGEKVEVTMYLQKQDGSWRKKHYRKVGSGYIPLEIKGCDLNGVYKSRIVYANQ